MQTNVVHCFWRVIFAVNSLPGTIYQTQAKVIVLLECSQRTTKVFGQCIEMYLKCVWHVFLSVILMILHE